MIGVRFHTRDVELLTHFTYLIAPYILLYQFQHPSYPDKLHFSKKGGLSSKLTSFRIFIKLFKERKGIDGIYV